MAENGNQTAITIPVLSTHGIPDGTKLATPTGMPDIVVRNVSPIRRVAIRVARVYVQGLVGFMPVAFGGGQAIANAVGATSVVMPKEFWAQLVFAASLALAPSVTTLLGNLLEWLIKQDQM